MKPQYQKHYQYFQNTEPDVFFENILKSVRPNLTVHGKEAVLEYQEKQIAFKDFFKNNYQVIDVIDEKNYSTNKKTYTLYLNHKNKDLRIVFSESGCFHQKNYFVDYQELLKTYNLLISKIENNSNLNNGIDFFKSERECLELVISQVEQYNQLKKLDDSLKDTKPKHLKI